MEQEQAVQAEAPAQEPIVAQEVESTEQINWRKFREAREVERKQREAAEKRAAEKEAEATALKAAMESILNKPTARQNEYYENQDEETEDQRINKKVEAALLLRERQMEEQRRAKELQEYPQKLASDFKDFSEVCSPDNLDYLEFHYPEVAHPYRHLPEGYEKWAQIYKAVKRFVPNTDSKKQQAKAEKNFAKPQSMSVPGVTQTGDTAPVYMDDKRRQDNWARMQRVMRGA